jgi:hypothetical protein
MTTQTDDERRGFDALMHEACVVWGFCGTVKVGRPVHVLDIVPARGPVTADQFVDWLFLADNLNPNVEPERWARHKAALRAAFVKHMGGDVVDARLLRYSSEGPEDDDDDPEVLYREPIRL